jgi:hypothetical protein
MEVQRVIVEVLAPFLGKNVAEASARGYVNRLASTGAVGLGAQETELLASWIAPGLKVFAGEARAAQVTAELKVALQKLVASGPRP